MSYRNRIYNLYSRIHLKVLNVFTLCHLNVINLFMTQVFQVVFYSTLNDKKTYVNPFYIYHSNKM